MTAPLLYNPQTWVNDSAGNTPLDADRLNYIETGIAALEQLLRDQIISMRSYSGFDPTGATDSGPALQQAILDAQSVTGGKTRAILVYGSPRVDNTLDVGSGRGLHLLGVGEDQNAGVGTRIDFNGDGDLLRNGTDLHPSDHTGVHYDGNQGFVVSHITLAVKDTARNAKLAINFGTVNNYRTGTCAFRDLYGGDIILNNVSIRNFETGFYGLQSDVNKWDKVTITFCKTAFSLDSYSDQFTMNHFYSFLCERILDLMNVSSARFYGCQFVGSGTDTINPIRIRASNQVAYRVSTSISFDDCWFESYQGFQGVKEAFVEIGVGDANPSTQIHFRNPYIITPAATDPNTHTHVKYFCKIDQGDAVSIENPAGLWQRLDKLFLFVGSSNPSVLVRSKIVPELGPGQPVPALGYDNTGTGNPSLTIDRWGDTPGVLDRSTFARGRVASAIVSADVPNITNVATDTITVTFTAAAGRRYELTACGFGCASTVAGDFYQVQLMVGSTPVQQARHGCANGAQNYASYSMMAEATGLSGSVTIHVQVVRISGTGTLTASAGQYNPTRLLVKDIGV